VNLARVIVNVCMIVSVIISLFFGFLFFAAYSDYNFRDCPDANQCEDAVTTMYGAGIIIAVAATTFAISISFIVGKKQ
jgi:UDP-N-acetylmuramyl pentapeptide phosphotransferase/UDP-N-acetylglucosamine-1-phosphate transferase